MQTYLYKRITENKGAPRLWLDGKEPERAGFSPGVRYTVSFHQDINTVTLSVMDAGKRVVTGKEKSGRRIPVIDLNSHQVLQMFEGFECVRVIFRKQRIHIVPAVAEIKRRERLAKLAEKLKTNQPISIGSLSHGGGILSHAIHQGLSEAGMASTLVFANDIREELLQHASAVNDAWNSETVMLAAPMQELAMDRWALEHLPYADVLEAGLACSGASVAGRAKRGTECAEAHPEVGHLIVSFIQLIQAANPSVIILENVKPYASTASIWILRNSLRDMGYDVHETILEAAQFNELEHRDRMCLVAVTRGMHFDFDKLAKPELKQRKLGEVLDQVAPDDPSWSSFDYLKRHQERHAAKGNGFQMQVFTPESEHIGTITKGYSKIRATDPKIAHPTNPELMRQLTPAEHARCKGIPEKLIDGMGKTIAHETLGQSVCYAPFKALGKLLAGVLTAPIDVATKVVIPDLLSAA